MRRSNVAKTSSIPAQYAAARGTGGTENVEATLAAGLKKARERGLDSDTLARRGDDPAEAICEMAAEGGVELLVIGNQGMNRGMLGSVPRSACQHALCSVVVAKTT